jgi:Flp pilus assembly protein TadD
MGDESGNLMVFLSSEIHTFRNKLLLMLKANIKHTFSILTLLTLALLTSCTGPEEKRANSFKEIAQLHQAGQYTDALALLEILNQQYPNDPEILRHIGDTHQALGNSTEAAFYLSVAHDLTPEDVELLYQTYRAQENANQPDAAYRLLEKLVAAEPSAISDVLWLRLGELRAQAQQTQAALDAYLTGVDPNERTPTPETAAAIGTLFKKLENLPQAERWFEIAANSDDPNALPALFGLLEIHLRNKNWSAAETAITQLDQQFPGALDASEQSAVRDELKRWRTAQEAMQAELAKTAAAQQAAAEAASALAAAEALIAEEITDVDKADTETASDNGASGKAQILTDLEHAEAMAETPAKEATAETETKETTVAYDPNIAIEPAEPELSLAVSYDQQKEDAIVDYMTSTTDLDDTIASDALIATNPTTKSFSGIRPTRTPHSLDQLLADAESASIQHDYKQAIQLYWQALGRANNRADIWNKLSLAYRLDGQAKNAETTALEATRLAPQEIDYTLDYLRSIQRTKQPEDFLAELETAYDRFPRSPEIALSLARGYERISGNNSTASILYKRFIALAPNHPLRTEAEAALSRLR